MTERIVCDAADLRRMVSNYNMTSARYNELAATIRSVDVPSAPTAVASRLAGVLQRSAVLTNQLATNIHAEAPLLTQRAHWAEVAATPGWLGRAMGTFLTQLERSETGVMVDALFGASEEASKRWVRVRQITNTRNRKPPKNMSRKRAKARHRRGKGTKTTTTSVTTRPLAPWTRPLRLGGPIIGAGISGYGAWGKYEGDPTAERVVKTSVVAGSSVAGGYIGGAAAATACAATGVGTVLVVGCVAAGSAVGGFVGGKLGEGANWAGGKLAGARNWFD